MHKQIPVCSTLVCDAAEEASAMLSDRAMVAVQSISVQGQSKSLPYPFVKVHFTSYPPQYNSEDRKTQRKGSPRQIAENKLK